MGPAERPIRGHLGSVADGAAAHRHRAVTEARGAPPGPTGLAGPVVWAIHLLLPLVALWLLVARPGSDVMWEHHATHFWLVLTTAVVNVALALVVAEGRGAVTTCA